MGSSNASFAAVVPRYLERARAGGPDDRLSRADWSQRAFKRLANEWATDATADVDTLWADLDNHFPKEILRPNSLADEVDQRRFLIELVSGERVRCAIGRSGQRKPNR